MPAAVRRTPCYYSVNLTAVTKDHLSRFADQHIADAALRAAALRYETEVVRFAAAIQWQHVHGLRVAKFMQRRGIVAGDGSEWDRLLAAESCEIGAEIDRQCERIDEAALAFKTLAGETLHQYIEARICAACPRAARCSRMIADACRQRYNPLD